MGIGIRNRRADALQQIIAEHAISDMTDEGCQDLSWKRTNRTARKDHLTKGVNNLRLVRDL
ncbi:MAG: hypothetical protein JWO13_2613 [Acidobacteriales bacterium]|nr:hypothetical protein [Terriglobales bacterium]